MVYWIEGTTWFRGLVNEVLFPENVKDKTIYVEVGSLERMVRDRGSGQEQWVKREKGEVSKIASQLLSLSRK